MADFEATFLQTVSDKAPKFERSVSDDGEIFYSWGTERGAAIVAFESDGSFGYAMKSGGRFIPGAVNVTGPMAAPPDLASYLLALA